MRFDHVDYLKNPEMEYSIKQMRLRAKTDGGAWLAECEEASRCADASLTSILAQKGQIDTQITQTVSNFVTELRRAAELFPKSEGVFANAMDTSAFGLVCSVVLRTEEWTCALRQSLERLTATENALCEACARAADAHSLLAMAKQAAYPEQTEQIRAAYQRADDGLRALEALSCKLAAERTRLLETMSESIPSVMERIRVDADFDRGGKACRPFAARERLGELIFVLEHCGIVEF